MALENRKRRKVEKQNRTVDSSCKSLLVLGEFSNEYSVESNTTEKDASTVVQEESNSIRTREGNETSRNHICSGFFIQQQVEYLRGECNNQ